MIKLDWQDKIALANMDALKEELEYRLGLRKLIQEYNPFNCWKPLKTIKPQRKNEICLSAMVAKAEKINCMRTRQIPCSLFNGQSAAKPRTEEGSTTIPFGYREYNNRSTAQVSG